MIANFETPYHSGPQWFAAFLARLRAHGALEVMAVGTETIRKRLYRRGIYARCANSGRGGVVVILREASDGD